MDSFLMMLLGISLVVFVLPFTETLARNFLFLVIPLNLLADALIPLFGGTLHSGLLRGGLLLGFIALTLPRLRLDRATTVIVLTLGYFLLVILAFSSSLATSMDTYLKVLMAMMMFPIGYYALTSWGDVEKLVRSLQVALAVIVVTFAFNQVFQVGAQEYRAAAAAYGGGSGVYPAYVVAYIGCLLPLMLRVSAGRREQWITLALFGMGVVVMLLLFRRGPLVVLALGFLVHLALSQWATKARLLRLGAGLGLMLLLLLLPFWGRVEALYQHRVVEGIERELGEKGGRKGEVAAVWQVQQQRPLARQLFGEELFNSYGRFAFTRQRALHVDYMIILHGGGWIGLALFLLVYGCIAWQFRQEQRGLPRTPLGDAVKGAFWGLLLGSLLLSATNQLWALTPYSSFFLLAGVLTRVAAVAALPRLAPGPAASALHTAFARRQAPVRAAFLSYH